MNTRSISVMPRLASAAITSGCPRRTASASSHSSTVKLGWTPGMWFQDSTSPEVSEITALYVAFWVVSKQVASARRSGRVPLLSNAATSALDGSDSSTEVYRQLAPTSCVCARIFATVVNSSAERGSRG
ncbi:Uncharacterised protein [Mycobacteroides abscessus subsp. abscessus]|nr:Uncharacterised protein [Mycobacteroides abscessus subsp. abscessus]SKT98023.1 Uncharacterised protein [Mycobacteroides abscessus subsp. abscessus]